jgi:hypothetical protein
LWIARQQEDLSNKKHGIAILGMNYPTLVVPAGEVSNYDVEDLHKILEFTGFLEPLTD